MANQKIPNALDMEIGARMRARRIMLSMSQEKLGAALGVSFQQIQKYEKGTNRISAGRMAALARVLEVPVAYFYGKDDGGTNAGHPVHGPGFTESGGQMPLAGMPPLEDPEAERLVRAFGAIDDPKVRRHVLELVDALSRGKS